MMQSRLEAYPCCFFIRKLVDHLKINEVFSYQSFRLSMHWG